ncbi:acyl-CoA carboxylase subunit epsilon [Streptomyces sp. NPDC020490]|uniref:acyl-CoA carboxylase subunit epsilon n=1 Tax=Streptomyces sp. NPDC020490 TaxID=3365078 RepID=UPI0037BAE063
MTTPLVRVVRGGELGAEELAALTAVLLSRAAAAQDHQEEEEEIRVVPLWERTAVYRSPVSWRD